MVKKVGMNKIRSDNKTNKGSKTNNVKGRERIRGCMMEQKKKNVEQERQNDTRPTKLRQ